jgi:hypothetical protein
MDDYRTIVDMHKLLRDILSHSVTGSTSDDQSVIHMQFYIFCRYSYDARLYLRAFYDSSRVSYNGSAVRYIGEYHGVGTDGDVVADMYRSEDSSSRHNLHVVTDRWSSGIAMMSMSRTDSNELQTIEIFPDTLDIEISGIVVLKVCSLSDARTPDMECRVTGAHPSDEYTQIFSQAIIEKVSKGFLARHRFDKVQDRSFMVLYFS